MERLELARLLGGAMPVGGSSAEPVVIAEAEPERFMTAFAAAAAGSGPVFLADPAWGNEERRQLAALIQGGRREARGGRQNPKSKIRNPKSQVGRGWLMIPSGGSGGRLKLARHDERTIDAAVQGWCGHFGMRPANAIGVLPLHHVSGLMAWLRCALTGGEFLPWDWKRLEAGELPAKPVGDGWTISLVPTQLQRLVGSPRTMDWLRRFRAIFVGGGPIWPELAVAAARAGLPLSLSYGLTETAAMVAALRPDEFAQGARSCGAALPHAHIAITAQGTVCVAGESVFRGYWPELRQERAFETEDLGRFDERGHLHILGRSDAIIITGGEKVSPAEVEAALRATGEFDDVAVIGVPDAEWGQALVACYPAAGRAPDLASAAAKLGQFASYKRPRRYIAIADWPRNAQGKLNRARLREKMGLTGEKS